MNAVGCASQTAFRIMQRVDANIAFYATAKLPYHAGVF
jgi:hypothetical protein